MPTGYEEANRIRFKYLTPRGGLPNAAKNPKKWEQSINHESYAVPWEPPQSFWHDEASRTSIWISSVISAHDSIRLFEALDAHRPKKKCSENRYRTHRTTVTELTALKTC